jgi:DNA-binding HxlR family transcriptional regulator
MENCNCPVTLTANVIGGKWKPSILFFLEGGTRRFGELQKLIPGLTKKMLPQGLCRSPSSGGILSHQTWGEPEADPEADVSLGN